MHSTVRSVGRAVRGLVLASVVLPARVVNAQSATVPFAVGEELVYRATFGGVKAGSARMRVDCIETVRGRPAYHVVFTIEGGIPMLRVHDRYESWIDVETLSSLRHVQRVNQGGYRRNTTYEIYPDRLVYQKNEEPFLPTVANPLDEASFIYAVRVAGVGAGETRSHDRYFMPDRNPVVLAGLAADTVTVGAGTFVTTVVRPSIKTGGLFAETTDARIWFSGEPYRYPVKVRTKFAKIVVTLTLESITRGE